MEHVEGFSGLQGQYRENGEECKQEMLWSLDTFECTVASAYIFIMASMIPFIEHGF
jgi:hypothetical protein